MKPKSFYLSVLTSLLLCTTLATAAAILQSSPSNTPDSLFSIQQNAQRPDEREAAIQDIRSSFLYGPPVAGGPYFPSGSLGNKTVAADYSSLKADSAVVLQGSQIDSHEATQNMPLYNGLDTLEDYTKLYNGDNWENTIPTGIFSGSTTNFTQDLFFSMERLSNSPYSVRRLDPSKDTPAFEVYEAEDIAGSSLDVLFQEGRLFYADYRDQATLKRTNITAAACDAFFYIDEAGRFLPLAIRTNAGANLIYTPLDSADDWLLAKIMFNANDIWYAQWKHVASTHEVVQIAYMAAIRTLSEQHPVLALLKRPMLQVFAIQPLVKEVLFARGGILDSTFAFPGAEGEGYTTNLYKNGAGRFQANYFLSELRSRGLIDCETGPQLRSIPFYEDAFVLHSAMRTFMTEFVQSYYNSDTDVLQDKEIQAWVKEAQGPAEVLDFPTIDCREHLIDVLTHFVHLVSTSHHTVNGNELLDLSLTLPFHPTGLYKELPTTKNSITNVADYLPPFNKVLKQFYLGAILSRPNLIGTNRTVVHMFDDANMLSRMNTQTRRAAEEFKIAMLEFSAEVSGRTFDEDGLSQGMPLLWKALDPNVVPYSVCV